MTNESRSSARTVRRLVSTVGLSAHIGRGVQRVLTDAALGHARSVPRTMNDLDAATMSRLIGRDVTSVSVMGGDAGTTSRARLALNGDQVPQTVFVKMPATSVATRLMGELGRLGHTEVRFYDQLASGLDGVPECHGSSFDPLTGRFVLVLEDLPAEQCEFPDTLHPLDRNRTALVVERLAALHGAFWYRSTADRSLSWLYTPSGDHTSLLTGTLLKTSARRISERTDIPVERGRFIDEHYRAVAEVIDRPPHTVMHGDAHPGNVYFRNGAAGLLDWQAVRRGNPGRELAYTLVTGMTTDDRRHHERDLLDLYRDALVGYGGPRWDRDDLWVRYRQGALYAYVAPLITAGMGGMQTEDIAIEGLRRGVAALEDLQTVALLRKEL